MMTSCYSSALLVLLAICFCIYSTQASVVRKKRATMELQGMTGADELNMTTTATKAFNFNQMKAVIANDIINVNMQKDIWLIKYLRAAKDMSIPAIDMINRALAFRKVQGFDEPDPPTSNLTLPKLDFAAGYKRFEASTTELDFENRIILFWQVGKWGLLKAIKSNMSDLYERTAYRLFEEAANKAVESYTNGSKNGQYVMVMDYDEWTSADGGAGCGVPCLDIVSRMILTYSRNWPMFVHRIILVNTADDFKLFTDLLVPLFTQDVKDRIHVFGRKKGEWCPEVAKIMDHPKLQKYCELI